MKGNFQVKTVKSIFSAVVFTLFVNPVFAASVSLAWDPSPSTNVVGYTVYFGNSSGNYSEQVDAGSETSVLVQGINRATNYFFAVTARTSDGLESLPSNEVDLPSEKNPPQVVITSPTSSATFVTTNVSVNLGGTASDDFGLAQVSWSNHCSHASGVASGTTSWSAANVSLCLGTNIISIIAKDAAGNVGNDTITIVRNEQDKTAPQVAITGPSSSATFATTNVSVNLGGTASDAVGVTQVSWSNHCSHASGVASGTASWSAANVSLCLGTNIISITAKDAAGNVGNDTITIVRNEQDKTSPQVAITGPSSSATFTTTNVSVNLGGTASDAVGVTQVSWSNHCSHASGVASGTTSWSAANVSLCLGTNTISIIAKDAAGNVGSDTITIVRNEQDKTSPQVAITGPSSSATFATTNASVNLGGTASDLVGVTQVSWSNHCSQASGVASGTASWSAANLSLCLGTNIISITAKDAAGNVGSDTITIVRNEQDKTAPLVAITGPSSSATFTTTNVSVNLGGTASDADGVTQVSWSNHCSHASGVASGTTSWSTANVSLCLGTNTISIIAKDGAGNSGTDFVTIIRHQPSVPVPQISVTAPGSGSTFVTTESTIDFSGTASGGSGLEVSWSNRCSHATGLASGTTIWTVSDVSLCLGTNFISFTARDAAGNLGSTVATIIRNGPGCEYSISHSAIHIEAAGGMANVSITADADCEWSAENVAEWVRITSGASGSGNGVVTFSVDPNSACSPRDFVFVIAGINFTVTQAGAAVAIESVVGTYNGLFDGPLSQSVGSFTLKKGSRTAFSGNIKLDGKQHSFSGKFDAAGLAHTQINRSGTNALSLELHLEPCAPDLLSVTIADGDWIAVFSADRSVFNAKTDPAPYAGQYTIAVSGVTPEPSLIGARAAAPMEISPEGIGFASVRVLPNGRVKVTGNVGDGERFVQSTFVSKDGVWFCYVPLYRKAGLISGSLTFQTGNVDPHGTLTWFKPAISKHRFYPEGFLKSVDVFGSPYRPPASKAERVLNFSNGTIILDGNNPAGGLAKDVVLLPGSKMVPLAVGEDRLSFRIQKNVGTFTGTIRIPGHARPVKFKGGLLQNQNAGYGLFLSTNQSGQFVLEPAP